MYSGLGASTGLAEHWRATPLTVQQLKKSLSHFWVKGVGQYLRFSLLKGERHLAINLASSCNRGLDALGVFHQKAVQTAVFC